MKDKSKLLTSVVSSTVMLLFLAGALGSLGICDASLDWDIFTPRQEKFVYALFGVCAAFALTGVAISAVVAGYESARSLRIMTSKLARVKEGDLSPDNVRSSLSFSRLILGFCLLLGVFGFLDLRLQEQRFEVFRRTSAEKVRMFNERLVTAIEKLGTSPFLTASENLHDIISSMRNTAGTKEVTLYLPDAKEAEALWGYTAWRGYYFQGDGFARFYVLKRFELAMVKAIAGDQSLIEELNKEPRFEWYGAVKDRQGKTIAIVRIDGRSDDVYQDY